MEVKRAGRTWESVAPFDGAQDAGQCGAFITETVGDQQPVQKWLVPKQPASRPLCELLREGVKLVFGSKDVLESSCNRLLVA